MQGVATVDHGDQPPFIVSIPVWLLAFEIFIPTRQVTTKMQELIECVERWYLLTNNILLALLLSEPELSIIRDIFKVQSSFQFLSAYGVLILLSYVQLWALESFIISIL